MTSTWNEQVESIRNQYAERIVKVLDGIRAALVDAGYKVSEPFDLSGDDYQWALLVYIDSTSDGDVENGDVDISLKIAESTTYDGTEDGINFALDMTTVGGRCLGGLTPYNYTEDVWVRLDKPDEIEQRFRIFEAADPADILELLP